MKKAIFAAIGACLMALGLMACGGAHAQAVGNGQAQFVSATNKSVDLWSGRYVDLTPGAQKVTDKSGNVISGAFVNNTAFTSSEAAKRYMQVGTYLYQNMSQSAYVECFGGNTVIAWNTGGTETISDSCSRAISIFSASRR